MSGFRLWQIAGWTMLHYFWVGAALGAMALLIGRRLRLATANVRYLFALGSLLLLIASPVLVAVVVTQSTLPPSTSVSQQTETISPEETRPTMAATGAPATVMTDRSPISSSLSRNNERILATLNLAAMCLPWLWLCGTPLSFALTTAGLVGAERLRRQSRPLEDARISEMCRQLATSLQISYRVGVAICDRIAAPILVGVLRPMILLPAAALAGWDSQQVEMVLLHELAHVRRYDNLVNLLQRIVESLLFFQPMVWIISGWVRREREHCCDELVVARTDQPHAYAEVLVTLAERLAQSSPRNSLLAHPQAVSSMAERPLVARIRRILKKEEQSMQVSRKAVAAVLAGMLTLAAIVGAYYCMPSFAEDSAAASQGPAATAGGTDSPLSGGDPSAKPNSSDARKFIELWNDSAQKIWSYDITLHAAVQTYSKEKKGLAPVGNYVLQQRFMKGSWRVDFLKTEESGTSKTEPKHWERSDNEVLAYTLDAGSRKTRFWSSAQNFGYFQSGHGVMPVNVKLHAPQLYEALQRLFSQTFHDMLFPKLDQAAVSTIGDLLVLTVPPATDSSFKINYSKRWFDVVLDMPKGPMPVRLMKESDPKGEEFVLVENEFARIDGGLWVPAKSTFTVYSKKSTEGSDQPASVTVSEVELSKSKFNVGIDPDLFEMPFPPGTVVRDEDKERNYVQGPDGARDYEAYGEFLYSASKSQNLPPASSPAAVPAGAKPDDQSDKTAKGPQNEETASKETLAETKTSLSPPASTKRAAIRRYAVLVSGQVVDDETGRPVNQFVAESGRCDEEDPAKITWGYCDCDESTSSHPKGKFRVPIAWDSGRRVRIVAAGYLPQPLLDKAPGRGVTKIENHVVRLKRGYDISGRVFYHDGAPAANASVFLVGTLPVAIGNGKAWQCSGRWTPIEDKTVTKTVADAAGRFTLSGGGGGAERIAVWAPRLSLWVVPAPDAAAAKSSEFTINLPEPGQLIVKYDIPGGDTKARLQLQMNTSELPLWHNIGILCESLVANKDQVTFDSLPPGEYSISRQKSLFYYDHHTVAVESGKTTTSEVFVRARGASVEGRLVGLKKGAITSQRGAVVRVYPVDVLDELDNNGDPPVSDALVCDPDGKFKTERLLPGQYAIIAEAYLPTTLEQGFGTVFVQPTLFGRAVVTVPERGEPQPVTIELQEEKGKGQAVGDDDQEQSDSETSPQANPAADSRPAEEAPASKQMASYEGVPWKDLPPEFKEAITDAYRPQQIFGMLYALNSGRGFSFPFPLTSEQQEKLQGFSEEIADWQENSSDPTEKAIMFEFSREMGEKAMKVLDPSQKESLLKLIRQQVESQWEMSRKIVTKKESLRVAESQEQPAASTSDAGKVKEPTSAPLGQPR